MRSVGGLGRLIPKSTGGRVALGAFGVVGGMAGYSSIQNSRRRARNTAALTDIITSTAEKRLQNIQLVPVHGQAI
jgi:hypothetical protein